MIIDIKTNRTKHCWVVCIDTLEVNFNSLEAASAFVSQLKARIDAPHSWPIAPISAEGHTPAIKAISSCDTTIGAGHQCLPARVRQ